MYNKNTVFAAACASMMLFGIVMISLGALLPSISTAMSLTEVQLGGITLMLPLGILTGSLIFGPVVDRYGYKLMLILCTVLIIVGLEGIAFADTLSIIKASVFTIGVGGGAINGAGNGLAADITENDKGAKLSLLGVFYGIGAISMPLVISLLEKSISINDIVKGVGAVLILVFIFIAVVRFPAPKKAEGVSLKEYLTLFTNPTLLLCAFVLFFVSAGEGLVGNWTTTYFGFKGLSSEELTSVLIAFPLAMTVTRLVLGFTLSKIPETVVIVATICCALAASVLLIYGNGVVAAAVSFALFGVGLAAGFPVMVGRICKKFADVSGTAISIALVIALTGNSVANYVTGSYTQSSGLGIFPYILIAIFVMILAMYFISDRFSANKTK